VSNFLIVASWCSKFTLAGKIKKKETFNEILKANDHAPYSCLLALCVAGRQLFTLSHS
jgi:hypothetical protein